MGQEGIEPPLLVLQTSALTNLATDPIIVVPAGIEPAISTFKVWWLCQRRLQDNNGYLRNLLRSFLTNLNFILDFGLNLNFSLLDSIEPSNTTPLFIILFFCGRRGNRTPKAFTPSRFQGGVLVHSGAFRIIYLNQYVNELFCCQSYKFHSVTFKFLFQKKNPRTFGSGVLSNCYTFITNLICFLNHMTC